MRIEFDPVKAAQNVLKHGVRMEQAAAVLQDPKRRVKIDRRRNYDEVRFVATGAVGSRIDVLVYTIRGGAIRIISGRKANDREKRHYDHVRTRPP